ncbi:MAG: 2TM domain-containing protein [Marinirhabdus sp.]
MEDPTIEKYNRAKKKLEDLKGFYTHLAVYIVVNLAILLSISGVFYNGLSNIEIPGWGSLATPFFWGIGLAFHYFHVKGSRFFKGWEERKIKELMEKDEKESQRFTKG